MALKTFACFVKILAILVSHLSANHLLVLTKLKVQTNKRKSGKQTTNLILTDCIKVLHPTRHKIYHFGDVFPSQSLGLVLKN